MKTLHATVDAISSNGSVHLISLHVDTQKLTILTLELPSKVDVGSVVELSLKPTHIAVATDVHQDISYTNQLRVKLHSMQQEKLLTTLILQLKDMFFESLITTEAAHRLKLSEGEPLIALIKESEIAIAGVIDE